MAEIKGITIELNGDSTNLQKAINKVRGEAKSFDKELSYIDKSLKFNPRNIDLIRQKIAVLSKATDKGEQNIKDMKKALETMKKNGIDETSADYRELQREIIKAESKQKEYNAELRKLKAAASPLGRASAQMKELGNKATAAGEALRGVSMAAGAFDVALAGLAVKSGKAADDLNTLSKVSGIGTDELQKYKLAADLADVSVEAIVKSQTKLKKSMYTAQQATQSAVDENGNLVEVNNATAEAFDKLGVSVTDANGELKGQDEVFNDVIKALGEMQNETERDALAMQIFGKSATELNPLIEDSGEAYQKVSEIFAKNNLELVDQETIDKANQFNDTIDEIKMTGTLALQTLGMKLAGYLQPILEKVAGAIEKVFEWLNSLDPEVVAIVGVIAGVVAGLAPLLIIIGKIAFAISSIMGLLSTLGVSIGALSAGALLPIIGVIAAVIAIGVLLYKNWDKIKAKAKELKDWVVKKWGELKTGVINFVTQLKNGVTQLWEGLKTGVKRIAVEITLWTLKKFMEIRDGVKNAFSAIKETATTIWNGIKTAITHPIETAWTFIKKIIDKIKGAFSSLKISLPKIKLPHFSISPPGWKLGDLLKGQIPSLGIDWYKKGGIFNSPQVIGVGDSKSPEAVIPIDKLKGMLGDVGGMTFNIYGAPGQDVQEIANAVEKILITRTKRRTQAWA